MFCYDPSPSIDLTAFGHVRKLLDRRRVRVTLALVAHAHADVHQELEKAFLIFQHIAPERRVIQRHSTVHQRPGGAIVEVRRDVFELAFADPAFDQQGQVFKVGRADFVQFFNQLWHLVAFDDLFFQAIKQPIALRIAHAEFKVGT